MTNLMDILIPAAHAQAAGGGGGGNILMTFAPFIGIFFIFYFMIIRPQQKKAKQQRESMKALRRGDKVLTAGGIIATVVKNQEDSDEMEVDLSNDVRVKILRSTITSVLESKAIQANEANKNVKKAKPVVKKEKETKSEVKPEEPAPVIELEKSEVTDKTADK
ncbi:Protein translocase subunit YajC (YajC) [Commensalibacter communis]|nr:preprotein translocase subunit YajC [Commensalibacter communis]CAI3949931.1 Protein translocase subunit YajC (YajC) [Commensalibacter communis]CAI3954816.1 Protein translocase subunit YajC (YajC) [Commensalibacter communis]CAI3957937.1 Protein translocase subunit YajC (YajC) [Commensalibacter communis]